MGPGVETQLIDSARMDHGGRGLLNAMERDLMNPLARFLFERHHQLRRGLVVVVAPEGGEITFDLTEG
jgi:hypothetical protein